MNTRQLKQYLFNNFWHGENGAPPQVSPLFMSVLPPPENKVWGIDVSHWNIPPVDMPRMVSMFGMSFAIIKSNDGSLKTRHCAEHVAQAKAAGIPYGLYCWLYPDSRVPISAQVNAWVQSYNEYKPALGLFIDAETTYYGGVVANPKASDLTKAHEQLRALIGLQTTYTSRGYANANLQGFDWGKYPRLWIANYTSASSPAMPDGVTGFEFWQFTAQLDGATLDPTGNKSLDGNYYNGTAEQFAAKYGGTTPPPNGGTMKEGVLTATTTSLRIRSGPASTYPQIGGILQGDKVYGELDTASGWLHIQWIIRAGGMREDIDGWCSASPTYITLTDYAPPTPELTINAVLKADGTVTGTWTEK